MRLALTIRTFCLVMLMAASLASPARAGLLWYNGDNDNRDSLANESKVGVETGNDIGLLATSLVYDNFVVPVGQVWTLSSVFANELMDYNGAVTTATWQIRSGVSAGNGGTLVASGDTAATATINIPFNPALGLTGEQVSATVTGVTLTAGTYWLAVAPDSTGVFADQAYIVTTSGANAVGTPAGNDGNSFITNNFPTSGPDAYNFTPTTTALSGDGDGPKIDFSMGVNGTFAPAAVPEPMSAVLVAMGVALPALVRARRRAQRVG